MYLSHVLSFFNSICIFVIVQSLQDEQVMVENKTEDVDHPLKSIEQVKPYSPVLLTQLVLGVWYNFTHWNKLYIIFSQVCSKLLEMLPWGYMWAWGYIWDVTLWLRMRCCPGVTHECYSGVTFQVLFLYMCIFFSVLVSFLSVFILFVLFDCGEIKFIYIAAIIPEFVDSSFPP